VGQARKWHLTTLWLQILFPKKDNATFQQAAESTVPATLFASRSLITIYRSLDLFGVNASMTR